MPQDSRYRLEHLRDELATLDEERRQIDEQAAQVREEIDQILEQLIEGTEVDLDEDMIAEIDAFHEETTTSSNLKSVESPVVYAAVERKATNEAIKTRAQRIGIPPTRLVEELEARDQRLRERLREQD